jgi:hypothetical protein
MNALVLPHQLALWQMRTYLIELVIVLECSAAYAADFIPDWHLYWLGFEDRCSNFVLYRRHVGTMFRDHVLYGLTT